MRQKRNHAHLKEALRNENGFRTHRVSRAYVMENQHAAKGRSPRPARRYPQPDPAHASAQPPSYSSEPHKSKKYKDY